MKLAEKKKVKARSWWALNAMLKHIDHSICSGKTLEFQGIKVTWQDQNFK